ncbi:MAG: ABC transporter ATP-binding protein, partial [Rhizobium sp.]|nr:ABC transporter ATP-binding protein [Rhizobium sp.]
ICERVYVFKGGRIVESGPTQQVLNDPQHPYTQELVGSVTHHWPPLPPFEGAGHAA